MDCDKLSLHDAILSYRNEYRVERIFGRLKSRLNIAPLFVKKDDQIEGMTYLLTLCVRVLTLIEFVVRRSLKEEKTELPDMHPENRRKTTAKPSKVLWLLGPVQLSGIGHHPGVKKATLENHRTKRDDFETHSTIWGLGVDTNSGFYF